MFGLGVLGNLGLVGGGGVPSWVPVGGGIPADYAFDFTQNLAWTRSTGAVVPASSLLTCTRAISGTGHTYDYAANSLGVYSGFLANVPRMTDLGLLAEESRVNVVLNNRDLTQGTWTPSNITAAKNQVGVDGVANGASSITATAGNGTILGATTVSSSARWQTAFVKRLVGSGTIQMTMDNGSTWTTITATSSWSRVSIPTQTLANPTVGFKIVTSGDAVAIDFVQNEASSLFATSPIATTSAAVTRNADVDVLTSTLTVASTGTLFAQYNQPPGLSNNVVVQVDDGGLNNRHQILVNTASKAASGVSFVGGSNQGRIDSSQAWSANTAVKACYAYAAGDRVIVANGTVGGTSATNTTGALTNMRFGCDGSSNQLNQLIAKIALWNSRLSNAVLQSLTS